MSKIRKYNATIKWTGANNIGTKSYTSYERSYDVKFVNKKVIEGSSDPAFRGDDTKLNPEEMLVASLSSCHMLWYLHLCSVNKIIVLEYTDNAYGNMIEVENGSGRFECVVLRPDIRISNSSNIELAKELHKEAHEKCFIANSVNFPVSCEAELIS